MQVTYITLFYQNAIYSQTENYHKLLDSKRMKTYIFVKKSYFWL